MELERKHKIQVRNKKESVTLIIPVSKNKIWVADDRDRNLTLIDGIGTVIKESADLCDRDSFIHDAKKYGNDILATCYLVPKILRLSGDGETVSTFYDTSPYITMGLCVTDDQQILLGLKSGINIHDERAKIIKIDSKGQELLTISSESANVLPFFWPFRLIELKDNVTIVVNDTSPNILLFFNKEGRKIREWNGYVGKKPVHIGYITHNNGKLYMTDRRAKKVYVMNTDATGARCLIDGTKEDLLLPSGIAFNHGQLLVGSWDGTITIFEYPQDDIQETIKRKTKETIAVMAKKESITPAKRRKTNKTTGEDGEKNRKEASPISSRDVEKYLSMIASQEDEKARNIRIMFVGNEQVGKTSLCKNMLEERLPDGGPERTDGIDIYIERFVIDMNTKHREKISEGEEHQNILQKLNDCVHRQKVQRNDNGQKNHSTDSSSEKKNISVIYTRDEKENEMGDEGKPRDISSEESSAGTKHGPEKSIRERVPVPEGLYDDLHYVLTPHEEDDPHDKCYASFWDFSGEKDYYNTHHIFLTSDAVYLLVFKLSDCVDSDEWLERIIFWLRSIAAYSIDNVPEKRNVGPPIILIGTHLDQLEDTDKDISKTIEKMYSKLMVNDTARKIVNNHVRGFYQVSNIRNSKQVISKIWDNILSSAPLQSQWERKLPCWWLERERVLMKKKTTDVKIQTFAEIKEIIKHLPGQRNTDEDVQMFLRYMHLTGDIIVTNIDRTEEAIIIIDPQWLVHAFRQLITSPKTELSFGGGRFEVMWPVYEKTAVLPMELIELAWKRDKRGGFIKHKEKLLSVMEKFGLVARVLWEDDEIRKGCCQMEQENTKYIVPCMLPEATPNTLRDVLNRKNVVTTCTLCFVFENGLMQFSVFDKIIACCIQRLEPFSDDLSNKMEFIQRGFVCLHLTCKWKVVICCKYEVMKVTLFKFSKSKGVEAGAGYHIRELLEELLENVWKSTHNLHETQLEYRLEFHNNYEVQEKESRIKANDLKHTKEPLSFDSNDQELTGLDYDVWFSDRADKSQVTTIEDEEIVKTGIRADILDDRVTERVIADISQLIGNNFYLLFAELGISITERDRIVLDNNFPNFRTKIQKLLYIWYSAKGEAANNRLLFQSILKHGINLQKHQAEQEDSKSKEWDQKETPKPIDYMDVEPIKEKTQTQEIQTDAFPGAQPFQQRDILSEKVDIINRFKNYIKTLQRYLLYDIWVGYIPQESFAWKDINNVRIVALFDDKHLPICPLPETFEGIRIYWRQKDSVSKEAIKTSELENIHINRQNEFSRETARQLFDKHSNLTIIHPSTIRSRCFATLEQQIDDKPCIALYCHIKGIIPLGEREFDRNVDGMPVDVREGFSRFTAGDEIHPGSAIKSYATGLAGTVGTFVGDSSGTPSFLTASHVVVHPSFRTLKSQEKTEYLESNNISVYRDTNPAEHIGHVIDWCFMSGDANRRGVDAALVRLNEPLMIGDVFPKRNDTAWEEAGYNTDDPPKICTDKIITSTEINSESMLDSRILKYGRTSTITSGTLIFEGAAIKVFNETVSCGHSETVELYGLMGVTGTKHKNFSEPGDSGALCCAIDKYERTKILPFGMLVAGNESTGIGYISLLEDAFKMLNLDIDKGIKLPPNDTSGKHLELNVPPHAPDTEKAIKELRSELKKHDNRFDVLETKMDKLIELAISQSPQNAAGDPETNANSSQPSHEEMDTE